MIRPYQKADRPKLLEIFDLNTPTYFDPTEKKDLEDYLDQHGDTYLTIEEDGKIVGGTGYQITDGHTIGRITWIFFHPDTTGKGLGKAVVNYCLGIFHQDTQLHKLVVTTSQLAHQFFGKFGFELVRTEKDYWGKGLDLYEMEIRLK